MDQTDKLAALSEIIAKHAREVVGKQWADIHRPSLKEILPADPESLIQIGDRQVPIKVLVESLRTDFIERNLKPLIDKITAELVAKAYQAIDDRD
jgi:hypothetical protein